VHLCKRKDKFNPATARICSDHFKEEELHWDVKHKLLQYSPRKSRKVRSGALPSLKLPLSSVEVRNASVSSMKGNAGRLMLCDLFYMLDRYTLCLLKIGQWIGNLQLMQSTKQWAYVYMQLLMLAILNIYTLITVASDVDVE
jgi:hypothetical protein